MIMPCMKLTSATAGVRRGMTAASGERILLLCPGAPGCTMGALPGAGVSDWPQAVRALAKSTTEVSTCRRPVIIIVFPTAQSLWHLLPVQDWMIRLATRPGNDALGNAPAFSERGRVRITAIEAARFRRLQ